ncbi:MAG: hypothetical protein K8S97_14380, partial [Anaerolineae bacterium]|nr:hypothetical protein [Anaerolineae bacterium]
MQSRQRWKFAHWSLSVKLTAIVFFTIALPGLLLLIPYTVFQRNANVQDQHSAYLDTLGPYALSQVELTFTELTGELERLIYTPADYQQL